MVTHDIVAQRDYLPKLQDVPLEVDEDEETVKIVQLVKSQHPSVIFSKIRIFFYNTFLTLRYCCISGGDKQFGADCRKQLNF